MAPVLDPDFETHEWKSEFASTHSGRNSPNIFAKVRRKLLLTPPVRNARSPRLTDEELDALTGDLPYATNYTYAYSKIYDPSLPDHWEVPNLASGLTGGSLAEQEHWSAASLSRQLFYILRFPIFLVLHIITYILEAFYHVIKISSYTIWDYFLYFIKLAQLRFSAYQDSRRRTALIRNRQDPFRVKLARGIRRFFEILFYVVWTPVRMYKQSKDNVNQYNYTSIKDQLENERASRMTTRSQALERSRKFSGLSKSPTRDVMQSVPQAQKNGGSTKFLSSLFSGSTTPQPIAKAAQQKITKTTVRMVSSRSNETPETKTTTTTTRTVKERSVTPRFRGITRSSVAAQAFESPEIDVDASLSSFGLRSRNLSHVNTPEPTFDIGHAAATSTPLMARSLHFANEEETSESKLYTVLCWIGYLIFFPFFAAKHIWLTIFDYGKSAYMQLTNYKQEPMETIHVRDVNEPAPSASESAAAAAGIVALPWTTRLSHFFSSFFSYIKESHQVVYAMIVGGVKETVSYFGGLLGGLVDKKNSKFAWCQILGLILALLLALFLFGFLTSENTAIRVKELQKDKPNVTDATDPSLPTVPVWTTVGNYVKHYLWMAKEFVYDLAFNTYNFAKPIVGRVADAPVYIWKLFVTGFEAVRDTVYYVVNTAGKHVAKTWNFFFGGFSSAHKSISGFVYEIFDYLWNGFLAMSTTVRNLVHTVFSAIYSFVSNVFAFIGSFFTNTRNSTFAFFQNIRRGTSNLFYIYIYHPLAHFISTGGFSKALGEPIKMWKSGTGMLYDFAKVILEWAIFIICYPFALMTRAWVQISNYAPEDVVQVIPIPQAITPTPILEKEIETLVKNTEVEDEELKIIPAPAPEPIPLPVTTPPPVVIHQTNVVETVDKDAIIKEVTEKLRAELSAQFHEELTAKFAQNYNTIIEQLKVQNTNIQFDNHQLEAIIRQLIYEYDNDKTGQVDYALESSGGAVVSTRCSETYKSYTRLEKFWDIPIYYHHYSPRVVIQRNSKSLFPGECWCFKENRGYIAVELSHFIDISSISYEHIGKEVAPEGNRSSAPKGVLVWAYKQIDDLNSRVLIGDYTFDLDGAPLQFFIAKHKPDFPVKFVELEVTSNYGAQFTCLYRLRVHGKMLHI